MKKRDIYRSAYVKPWTEIIREISGIPAKTSAFGNTILNDPSSFRFILSREEEASETVPRKEKLLK